MKILSNNLKKLFLIAASYFFVIAAYAQDENNAGARLKSLNEQGGEFASLFMLIIGIGGLILLFMGIWGLKKHAENPQQEPLTKPIILMVAGGLAAGFSAFQTVLSFTLTGSGLDNQTGRSGFSANDAEGGGEGEG